MKVRAQQDTRRLLESKSDLAATSRVAGSDTAPESSGFITFLGARYGAAREGLRTASNGFLKEQGEADTAAVQYVDARDHAKASYDWARKEAANKLLNPPPNQPLTAAERKRRESLIASAFPDSASTVGELGKDNLLQAFETTTDQVSGNPELSALGVSDVLREGQQRLAAAKSAHGKESAETSRALDVLNRARASFDRAQRAYAAGVEAVLLGEDRLGEIGSLLLAQDPAYRARRASGDAIDTEPGADDVDQPLPVPT